MIFFLKTFNFCWTKNYCGGIMWVRTLLGRQRENSLICPIIYGKSKRLHNFVTKGRLCGTRLFCVRKTITIQDVLKNLTNIVYHRSYFLSAFWHKGHGCVPIIENIYN